MSRWFRFYEKKRGDRRTGSAKIGSVGEALFFGFFFLLGCYVLAVLMGTLVIPEWRANRQFVPATCTVLAKRIADGGASDGNTFRPELEIEFQAEGHTYQDTTFDATGVFMSGPERAQAALEPFEVGRQYPCWFDPLDPSHAVVVRGYSGWLYLLLLVPASFIVLGGAGLIYTWLHWGTSAERRAAMSKRPPLDRTSVAARAAAFPAVPCDANWTNSPGTKLAYRLPIGMAQGWTLFAVLVASVLWNGLVAIFVVMAVHRRDWAWAAFITPFVLMGLGLIGAVIRLFMLTTGAGPTRLEISQLPLRPGGEYDVFLSQAGRLTVRSLEVFLVCEEMATYRQGTDMRAERQQVFSQRVFAREDFEINQGLPFENQFKISIPPHAMHSFKAGHNEIHWKLQVKGDLVAWPDYAREFPVVVYPGQEGTPGG